MKLSFNCDNFIQIVQVNHDILLTRKTEEVLKASNFKALKSDNKCVEQSLCFSLVPLNLICFSCFLSCEVYKAIKNKPFCFSDL